MLPSVHLGGKCSLFLVHIFRRLKLGWLRFKCSQVHTKRIIMMQMDPYFTVPIMVMSAVTVSSQFDHHRCLIWFLLSLCCRLGRSEPSHLMSSHLCYIGESHFNHVTPSQLSELLSAAEWGVKISYCSLQFRIRVDFVIKCAHQHPWSNKDLCEVGITWSTVSIYNRPPNYLYL